MSSTRQPELRRLSAAQMGLWFAQALDPDSPILNQGEYLEIFGTVNIPVFAAAMRQEYFETDALHVRFVDTDDGPRQHIVTDLSRDNIHPLIDVSGAPDPRAAALAWMQKDMAHVDDLINGPIGAAVLFRCGPEHFIFYQRGNHIVTDGLSGLLLVQHGAEIYSAMLEGRPYESKDRGSIFDLLDDEEEYRASIRYRRDREFWLLQLADRPAPVTLSGRPPSRSGKFIRSTQFLSATLTNELRAFGAAHGASLPQVITTAAALYLHRLTGATDFTIGIPLPARGGMKMRTIVGMASNVLPMRLKFAPDETLAGLMDRVSGAMLDTLRHQRYRGEDLRRDLGMPPEETDLFGLSVNVMPFDYELRVAGFSARENNLSLGPVNDLSIVAYDRLAGSEVRLFFDANPDHYTPESLSDHQRRFAHVLELMARGAPGAPLREMDMLSADERLLVLEGFNATNRPVPDAALPDLFDAQVVRTPNAVALMDGEGSLTYAALSERVNRLACRLISLGAGPGDLAGICIDRSIDMIVAMLATHKAGAAYLPLDPDYPPARVAFMAGDAAPALVLTTAKLRNILPASTRVLCVDDADGEPSPDSRNCTRRTPLLPHHPAYVIYTSGSTGAPKGVVVSHTAAVNHMAWMCATYPVGRDDRVLCRTSISFDASVWEIWLPLLSGAALCLTPGDTGRDPAALVEYIDRMGITIAQFVPSLLAAVCDDPRRPAKKLRLVFSGGEVLDRRLAEQIAIGWKIPIINLFGPTEATIQITHYRFDGTRSESGGIPIGRPIWNTRLYVLDAALEPVPVGIPGELFIAGAALASGYLNRPDLSEERFIADPFGKPGTRMYRTGDLVRWRPDGVLEYLGRGDQQVKIRGFRIEPGEIESALASIPGVAQAAVVAREGARGGKQLEAFVVPAAGAAPDPVALRQALVEQLPASMVPASVVLLDALPRTPNGKLDRNALPASAAPREVHREPRTPEEKLLCDVFAEVLNLERVGIDDNFFALGGHSLLVAKMLGRIRARTGVPVEFRTVFERPTVAELARELSLAPSTMKMDAQRLLPFRAEGELAPLFFIPPGSGLSWTYAPLTREIRPGRPIHGLQAAGVATEAPLPESIGAIAADYVGVIRNSGAIGPCHLAGWSFGGLVAFEMACALQREGRKVGLVALLDSFPPGTKDSDSQADATFLQGLNAILRANGDLSFSDAADLPAILKAVRQSLPEYEFLSDGEIARVLKLWRHSTRLVPRFTPSRFEGDVVLFVAKESQAEPGAPKRWAPYVGGRIVTHEIACAHLDMTGPVPSREIGRLLDRHLRGDHPAD